MQSELTERAKTAWNSIADEFNQWDALGLDEQETYVALTAALVDVPAVEPVAGYRRRLPQYAFAHYEFEQPGYESPSISDWEPLYTSPPLTREGEDSAEVIEELLRRLDKVQSNSIRAGELAWHPDSPLAESIEKVRALAATRSGSVTAHSGGDHG